jgi:excisionase family DNA binding protein
VSLLHAAKPSAEKLEGDDFYRRPMTKAELAKFLSVSPRTIDYWVSGRKIPFIKLGPRMVRFRLPDVERALQRFTVKEVSLL